MSKKKADMIIQIIAAVAIFFFVIGTVIATLYSVNQSDDYTHAMEIGKFHESFFAYIGTSFSYMIQMYKGWAGNFTSMFLQGWLSPLNNGGAIQLRLVMLVNAAAFFAAFIWIITYAVGRMFTARRGFSLAVCALVMFALMNYRCYYEIFYWFSGATSYSFPLTMLYVALVLGIKYISGESKKKAAFTGALVLGFLGAGGSLTLAGLGCWILVMIIVYLFISSGKWNKNAIALFAAIFTGTLINVVAPGNFARTDTNGTTLSLAGAIKSTVSSTYTEIRWLFHDTSFLILFLIFMIIGFYMSGELILHRRAYYTVSVLAVFSIPVAILPVVMGYGMNFLANRTLFVIDQAVYISLLNGAMCLGMVIVRAFTKNHEDDKRTDDADKTKRQMSFTLAAAMLVFLCVNNYALRDMESVRTLLCDMNGTFSTYYSECAEMERYFATCEGQDVTMNASDVPAGPANFSCFYLENSWVNEGIAQYYNMNSLTVNEDQ